MTKESPTYNETDVDNITDKYVEYFGEEYFEEISNPDIYKNNFMLNNPYEINYEQLCNNFGKEQENLTITEPYTDYFKNKRLSFGLNPYMDYILYDYFKDDRNREVNGTILVIGQDWYPVELSLRNPLFKNTELSPENKSNYVNFFRMVTSQNYLPIFINMVPGLRYGDKTTGNFKNYFEKDFLIRIIQGLREKPKFCVSWGAPVAESLYSYAENQPEEFQTIKEYLEKFSDPKSKWINIQLSSQVYKWFMLYHPSSYGSDWEKNKPALKFIEDYLAEKSPASVS